MPLPKLPDGFKWIPIKDLRRGEFFFYTKGGKRHLADAIHPRIIDLQVKSSLTDGRQVTRYIMADKFVIVYSK